MRRALLLTLIAAALIGWASHAAAEPSPPPVFESGHQLPETATPPPRPMYLQYVDVAVLAAALVLAAMLTHVWRWRKGLLALAVASLAYFGFYRNGCVCAIGAIQNVALGVAMPSFAIPLPVIAFLVLPLAFALVVGRVFCGSVCPLGAIQDVVLLKPVRLPLWFERAGHMLAYVYLALAVLFAATASVFAICQWDPFVAFFRLSPAPLPGSGNMALGEAASWLGLLPVTSSAIMLAIGVAVLALAIFVGRPYCRFLCPLGVLLGHASRLATKRVDITPKECIHCRLCEDACPFNAIRVPTGDRPPRRVGARAKAMLAIGVLMVPLLTAAGAYLGSGLSLLAAQAHPTVRLAQQVWQENQDQAGQTTFETEAFARAHGKPAELYAQASAIHHQFVIGMAIIGGFIGLIIGLKLLHANFRQHREDYQADRSSCLACGRCFEYCPVDRARRQGKIVEFKL